jgi:hypothetical protein
VIAHDARGHGACYMVMRRASSPRGARRARSPMSPSEPQNRRRERPRPPFPPSVDPVPGPDVSLPTEPAARHPIRLRGALDACDPPLQPFRARRSCPRSLGDERGRLRNHPVALAELKLRAAAWSLLERIPRAFPLPRSGPQARSLQTPISRATAPFFSWRAFDRADPGPRTFAGPTEAFPGPSPSSSA